MWFGNNPTVVTVGDESFGSFFTPGLGTLTFPFDARVNTVHKLRDAQTVETYSGTAVDDYGFKSQQQGLIGSEWRLIWDIIPGSFWSSLRLYYETIEPVTWDPKERAHSSGAKYIVRVTSFNYDHDHRILAHDKVFDVSIVVNIRSIV